MAAGQDWKLPNFTPTKKVPMTLPSQATGRSPSPYALRQGNALKVAYAISRTEPTL
jgi:hypothetical protein